MPQKTRAENIMKWIAVSAIVLVIVGIALFSIAQYKSLSFLATPGYCVFGISFATYLATLFCQVWYRRKKHRRNAALLAIFDGEYQMPPETRKSTVIVNGEILERELTKSQMLSSVNRRLDKVAKLMDADSVARKRTATVADDENARNGKLKRERDIAQICENCGTEMRKNIHDEWKCPYCDAAFDIDITALYNRLNAAKRERERADDEMDEAMTETAPVQEAPVLATELLDPAKAVREAAVKSQQLASETEHNTTVDVVDEQLFAELSKAIDLDASLEESPISKREQEEARFNALTAELPAADKRHKKSASVQPTEVNTSAPHVAPPTSEHDRAPLADSPENENAADPIGIDELDALLSAFANEANAPTDAASPFSAVDNKTETTDTVKQRKEQTDHDDLFQAQNQSPDKTEPEQTKTALSEESDLDALLAQLANDQGDKS